MSCFRKSADCLGTRRVIDDLRYAMEVLGPRRKCQEHGINARHHAFIDISHFRPDEIFNLASLTLALENILVVKQERLCDMLPAVIRIGDILFETENYRIKT